jgi:hypothetical protein
MFPSAFEIIFSYPVDEGILKDIDCTIVEETSVRLTESPQVRTCVVPGRTLKYDHATQTSLDVLN